MCTHMHTHTHNTTYVVCGCVCLHLYDVCGCVCACACVCLCMHVCVCLMCVCLAFRVMLNGMTKLATPLLASSSSLGRRIGAPRVFFLTRNTCCILLTQLSYLTLILLQVPSLETDSVIICNNHRHREQLCSKLLSDTSIKY